MCGISHFPQPDRAVVVADGQGGLMGAEHQREDDNAADRYPPWQQSRLGRIGHIPRSDLTVTTASQRAAIRAEDQML